jgi:ERCC4-type nuclease
MLLVDKRTGSAFVERKGRRPFDMYGELKVRLHGNVDKVMLDGGDFAFEGNGPNGQVVIGIERKALGDMLGSMRSGRYAGDQAIKMNLAYDLCYVIVEGIYRPSASGLLETLGFKGWKPATLAAKGPQSKNFFYYAELDKFIVDIEAVKNVIVVRSTSEMETVWQIVNRYNWWSKEWDEHKASDPLKYQAEISFSRVSECRMAVAQLPGIGWKKSKLVEQHFGSIENWANALPSEWREIDGIGEKLSVQLYGAVRKDHRKK